MTRQRWTLAAVVLGSGIVFLDSTIVNVALRAIGEQLPATVVGVLEGQSYIVNGYLLSSCTTRAVVSPCSSGRG